MHLRVSKAARPEWHRAGARPGRGTATGRLRRIATVLTAGTCVIGLTGWSGAGVATATTRPSAAAPGWSAEQIAKVDAAAQASIANGTTGVIVGISDPHHGRYLKAYGSADTAGRTMTADMHYRIASVTKTFTADAVLRLVDQGKVSLDDPIAKYVADLPNGDEITVRDLLAMRSGVYDFANDAAFFAQYTADPTLPTWTADAALEIMRAHASEFTPPNQTTVYCNSNYVLLGYVIEQASDQSARQYLNRLARRLGLLNTSYPARDTLPAPFAHGYFGTGAPVSGASGPARDVTLSNPAVAGTAGAMISTVPDMMRYARELATGVGLSAETAKLRQSWTPLTTTGVRLQYGLGITQLGDWVGHDGSIFGYSTMVFYLPAEQATVVVMGNQADEVAVPSQALWGEIVKELYPGTLTTWP